MIGRISVFVALGLTVASAAYAQSSGEKATFVGGKASAADIRRMMLGGEDMAKGVSFGGGESGGEKGVRPDTVTGGRPSPQPAPADGAGQQASASAAGCPPETRALAMSLLFETNSSQLSSETRRLLGEFASVVRGPEFATCRFLVVGHTDAKGGDAYNQALSEQRAEAVRSFLVKNDVAPSKLIPMGKGKRELYDAADPLSELNRRVEFRPER